MKYIRNAAAVLLVVVALISVAASLLAPYEYATQFREHANEPPSGRFLLGTDDLGRDRFSRLLYACRTSVLTAPVSALVALIAATGAGLLGGYRGGWADTIITTIVDWFLCLPWLFLLLILRALLPLNLSGTASITATALLLAAVGWAPGARVIRSSVLAQRDSPPLAHARAYGCTTPRLLFFHLLPNLRPALTAQFWILISGFLIADANLGALGLGVIEPAPSIGGMLVELRDYQRLVEQPWILAPAALLATLLASLHLTISKVSVHG